MTPFPMGRTAKDSSQITNSLLKVVKRRDGMFDLFLGGKVDRHGIPEASLRRRFVCGSDSVARSMTQSCVNPIKTAGQPEFSDGCNPRALALSLTNISPLGNIAIWRLMSVPTV
jgi:hypothetical protein